jgi:hypothetical protein
LFAKYICVFQYCLFALVCSSVGPQSVQFISSPTSQWIKKQTLHHLLHILMKKKSWNLFVYIVVYWFVGWWQFIYYHEHEHEHEHEHDQKQTNEIDFDNWNKFKLWTHNKTNKCYIIQKTIHDITKNSKLTCWTNRWTSSCGIGIRTSNTANEIIINWNEYSIVFNVQLFTRYTQTYYNVVNRQM